MKFSKEVLKGVTPFLILQTLHELGEAYGYEIMKNIRAESEGVFDFPDSTLYPILYRLEEQGLVSSEVKVTPQQKTRRYYALTSEGGVRVRSQMQEFKIYHEGLSRFLRLA